MWRTHRGSKGTTSQFALGEFSGSTTRRRGQVEGSYKNEANMNTTSSIALRKHFGLLRFLFSYFFVGIAVWMLMIAALAPRKRSGTVISRAIAQNRAPATNYVSVPFDVRVERAVRNRYLRQSRNRLVSCLTRREPAALVMRPVS